MRRLADCVGPFARLKAAETVRGQEETTISSRARLPQWRALGMQRAAALCSAMRRDTAHRGAATRGRTCLTNTASISSPRQSAGADLR
ncbi:hypothetical protein C0Q70_17563 [Pomacea canaliculata]|uniref:Uncharacterized protein n=1 Tax=Pomacea canaliculata TaxID=400727 RepID=A0A2T7NKS7_POMCA|nr:hypothetical protein C0Q70_17563 [Pomacea canaliculata]